MICRWMIPGLVMAITVTPATALPRDTWWATVQERIAADEYAWSARGDAWQAPNRAQGLRIVVGAAGYRIVPRTEVIPSRAWSLSLDVGVDAEVRTDGSRIERRSSGVLEWLNNRPDGLEHGLVLAARAAISWRLGGSLTPRFAADGRSVSYVSAFAGSVLHERSLRAVDANGRDVSARFTAVPGGVILDVDDEGATYPVTVTSLITASGWTADGGQGGALFGASVHTAGDVNGDGFSDVLVGAPNFDGGELDEGRAFLFLGSASGPSAAPDWTAGGGEAGAAFGSSVAPAGDVDGDGDGDVIVGAPFLGGTGRAFVFLGSPSGLSSVVAWTAAGEIPGRRLGAAVAPAGDVNGDGRADVIVGAPGDDTIAVSRGRALVYLGTVAGVQPDPVWVADGAIEDTHFGRAVSTGGDVNADGWADLIVGSDETAQLFRGSSSGPQTAAAWTVTGPAGTDFACAVGTAGDVNGDGFADVLVGSDGTARLYRGSGGTLSTTPAWTATGTGNDGFGRALAAAGDVNGDGYGDVLVGAPRFDAGETDEGRASLYFGSAVGLTSSPAWTRDGDDSGAQFGSSVATAGDVDGDGQADLLIGAPFHDGAALDEGRVFLFPGASGGPVASASWQKEADNAYAHLGVSLGTAGDVNGDGYGDLIVGAYGYDGGQSAEGKAWVFLGTPAGPAAAPVWSVEGNQSNAFLGRSSGTAGDVNGDGYDDVFTGAYGTNGAEMRQGQVQVFQGSATGLSTTPAWSAMGEQGGECFGYAAATAGDVNGDGYSDLVVGAYLRDVAAMSEGQVRVFHGSATGLGAVPARILDGDQADALFGYAVGSAGDVNGDGFSDVIVGAHLRDVSGGATDEGRASVYLGSRAGIGASPSWTTDGTQPAAHLGVSVAGAGDVNGDGFSDVIVGADRYTAAAGNEGRAALFLGSARGLATSSAWIFEGAQFGAFLGRAVNGAGDVNGDGYADLIVGEHGWGDARNYGRAHLFFGSPVGPGLEPSWTVTGDQAEGHLGIAVASAGDLDGDGDAEVMVGQDAYDGGQIDEGRVLLFAGNGGSGVAMRPRQRRWYGTPLAALGATNDPERMRLRVLGRTAFGRGKVRLEWEVEPLGVLLDGEGTEVSAAWMDTGFFGAELYESPGGLLGAHVHHWRARLLVDPATFPLGSASRWLTVPWNGVQEADFRTVDGSCRGVDDDADGATDCADCDDTRAAVRPGAPEINDGLDNQCPGDPGHGLIDELEGGPVWHDLADDDRFCWTMQAGATRYEIARGSDAALTACSIVTSTTGCLVDAARPAEGAAFFYLVRPSAPYLGSWGRGAGGAERSVSCAAGSDNLDRDKRESRPDGSA